MPTRNDPDAALLAGLRAGDERAFAERVQRHSAALHGERFLSMQHERRPGGWAVAPEAWPEERVESAETLKIVRAAFEALPPAEREVVRLRDVEGWDAGEVCLALGLSAGNQRVLLHRGRARVHAALERHLSQRPLALATA
jgi:RNA polymerase sigma-70 factor (ECF subfamily)